ncbi:MAG: alpha-L-fucosidase [Clostridia bacterium]|nr:alpha-L-fucosidase [Clostridia bacterium]
MRLMKKALLLLLVLSLLLMGLTGCKEDKEPPESSAVTTTTADDATTEDVGDDTTTEAEDTTTEADTPTTEDSGWVPEDTFPTYIDPTVGEDTTTATDEVTDTTTEADTTTTEADTTVTTTTTLGAYTGGGLKLPTTAKDTTAADTQPTQGGAGSDEVDELDLTAYPEPQQANTDWFVEAGYGIMVHIRQDTHNKGTDDWFADGQKTTWDECVNGVDVEKFADQVAETGAGYVILCIQQQDQFFAAPIRHYERLVGLKPGQACAQRDLPLDMMNALAERGVRFMLYFTGDGPWRSNLAFSALSGKSFPNAICNTEWNDTYVQNWSKMILELSLRYGDKLAGWFFDGMDGTKFTEEDLYWFARAAKAGNPNSLLSFNGAHWTEPVCYTQYEDYSFGEQFGYTYLPDGRYLTSKDGTYQTQWHIMAYLDGDQTGVMHTAEETIDYISKIMAKQGVLTLDVDLSRYGTIRPEHLEVLREVKAAIRN